MIAGGRARDVEQVALAAVRATREATVRQARQELPCILGVPVAGEVLAGETFDGETEAALFPGDLPDDPDALFRSGSSAFRGISTTSPQNADFRFLRVRPPRGKHWGIAAAFGLALTAQGFLALSRLALNPDVSLGQALGDFKVARDYPVFLSLSIPAIWLGLRVLDWVMWRVRD